MVASLQVQRATRIPSAHKLLQHVLEGGVITFPITLEGDVRDTVICVDCTLQYMYTNVRSRVLYHVRILNPILPSKAVTRRRKQLAQTHGGNTSRTDLLRRPAHDDVEPSRPTSAGDTSGDPALSGRGEAAAALQVDHGTHD